MNTEVYFSLGSNLGDRMKHLKFGLDQLQKKSQMVRLSPIYETEPWGYTDPKPYLNMVAKFETTLSPDLLMQDISKIETAAGRLSRSSGSPENYEARTLDIDILFYGNNIFENSELKIPHPRLHLRNFVLFPFADIEAEFVHPILGQTIRELKLTSSDTSKIQRIAERL